MACPICKGTGNEKENVFVCEKCDGSGKVDWVSNVISQNRETTSLDRINVRRLIIHLKSLIRDMQYEPDNNLTMDTLKEMMGNYLTTLKDKKAIDDYEITKAFAGGYDFDVLIKPSRSIDVVTMNIKI
jgi:predicted PP-loop superfamily ATPase